MPYARQQAPSGHQLQRRKNMSNSRRLSSSWFNYFAIFICLLCSGLASTNAAAHFYEIVPMGRIYGSDGGGGGGFGLPVLRLKRDLSAQMMVVERKVKEITSTAEPPPPIVDQPQGQCLLDGVLVVETSVTCEKQIGCRAIQKTGYCCPDYKCDCQKDGITYLNGDKLVDPETPCTVCYCQGGEILCSSVTCFHRDDCKPKYIPGRCCPEYDNCPVSVFDPSHNVNKSNNYPAAASNKMSTTIGTPAPPAPPVVAPKITIKEITKPIEIRITDDNKAIPIHQMLKPQSTTSTSTSTTTTTPTTNATESTTEAKAAADNSSKQISSAPTSSVATSLPNTPATKLEHNQNGEKSTISTTADSNASSSDKTKFSTDNNRHTALPVAVGINNGESLKLSASVAYPSTERNTVTVVIPQSIANVENVSINDSGEVSAEVAQLTEDGNAIPAFGAQELQHDASLNDPTKVNIKRENLATTESTSGGSMKGGEYASPELIDGKDSSEQSGGLQLQGTFDLEPETSGSDNIYHIILTTSGPRIDGSTDDYGEFKTIEDLQHSSSGDIQTAASHHQHSVVLPPPQISNTTDSPLNSDSATTNSPANASATAAPTRSSSTPANNAPSTTDSAEKPSSTSTVAGKHSTDSTHHMDEEEPAIAMEANPAYPSLPEDDFSLRDVNFPLSETDDAAETEIKDEQRSIIGAFDMVKSHKPAEEGSGNGIYMIENSLSNATYESVSNDSETEITSTMSAKIALLMNSAEDISAETAISNSSDFQFDHFSRIASTNDTKDTVDSEETQLSSETGSGDSLEEEKKLDKRREPTTPRPTQRAAIEVDIDELGDNASGDGKSDPMDDPKLDAESIKADENVEEGIVKQESGQKEDVLTVNAKPTEERAVEEIPTSVAATLGRLQQMFLQRFV